MAISCLCLFRTIRVADEGRTTDMSRRGRSRPGHAPQHPVVSLKTLVPRFAAITYSPHSPCLAGGAMKRTVFLLLVACVLATAVPGMSLSAETRADTATESGDAEIFVDDSGRFSAFEEELLARYARKGIISVAVAAYAKGTDIVFITADRKMTRAEFSAIASRSVREFKERFGLDKDVPIGAVLDYQKDAATDARTRFVLELR